MSNGEIGSRVVVVDDDQVFSGLLKTVLEFEEYEVTVVPWPDDVLPTVRQLMPVLILMDVHTGRGDTLGVLRDIRADEALKRVLVVMTSGMDRSPECLAAGADDFVLKPFSPSELLTKIAGLLSGAGLVGGGNADS
jgi:DNA-binding response OmpR family regulator